MLSRKHVESKIGKTFADKLDEPYVRLLGEDYSRRDIVEKLQIGNFNAATRLAKVLSRLGVTTVPKLHQIDPHSLYRTKGVGDASMFVAMSLVWATGGDPIAWWDKFDAKKAKRQKAKRGVQEE